MVEDWGDEGAGVSVAGVSALVVPLDSEGGVGKKLTAASLNQSGI